MELVTNGSQIFDNISYLEEALRSEDTRAIDFIKRGTCFVSYGLRAPWKFAPSRFIGYQDNTFEKHAANQGKDGRETNPAISSAFKSEPQASDELEEAYRAYCRLIGFEPNATGAFGVERKYWDRRK
ncbi:hypothetical protein MWU38_11445 [Qipengyuania sp. S6317L1]|uniref:hypothetical protein n=1 Tax=Qipengyuania sp. S6317L1 TaxID=2926410 RepID=UPI001FF2AD22|nr:hypothetical protein [Qipengyuania sp. S6317L1]MCK0099998.1 hypothetical protein [Qipengyuania sp. S6317L1]